MQLFQAKARLTRTFFSKCEQTCDFFRGYRENTANTACEFFCNSDFLCPSVANGNSFCNRQTGKCSATCNMSLGGFRYTPSADPTQSGQCTCSGTPGIAWLVTWSCDLGSVFTFCLIFSSSSNGPPSYCCPPSTTCRRDPYAFAVSCSTKADLE